MDNLLWIITFILGTVTFAGVFLKCEITYFGCGGIIAVWGLYILGVGIIVGIIGEVAGVTENLIINKG